MIRGPRPQRPFDGSAGIIAVFHALPRLLAPRHPPHALSSLAALAPPSRAGPVGAVREDARGRSKLRPTPCGGGEQRSYSPRAHAEIATKKHGPPATRVAESPVAFVMQLLPPPVCQRASAAGTKAPEVPGRTRSPEQQSSPFRTFLLTGGRCTRPKAGRVQRPSPRQVRTLSVGHNSLCTNHLHRYLRQASFSCQPLFLAFPKLFLGCGDDGIRTRDIVVANHALSH